MIKEEDVDYQIEVMYRMWVMAFERPEWFRDAKGTRIMLDKRRKSLIL